VAAEDPSPYLIGGHISAIPGQAPPPIRANVKPARYLVTAHLTCREATIVAMPGSSSGAGWEGMSEADRADDNHRRVARRSNGILRRYHVFNGLAHIVTLTFRDEPPDYSQVSGILQQFRRRLVRAGIAPEAEYPYTVAPEWGSRTGRLHLHMSVSWWADVGAVEVCEVCATDGLRAKRADIPPAGSLCVGCIWGLGFVGRPLPEAADPRSSAAYAGKAARYAAKDASAPRVFGRNSYRRSKGFNPPAPVQDVYGTLAGAMSAIMDLFDGEAPEWLGSMVGDGPVDLWAMRWGLTA
jgi:hypothetical protein